MLGFRGHSKLTITRYQKYGPQNITSTYTGKKKVKRKDEMLYININNQKFGACNFRQEVEIHLFNNDLSSYDKYNTYF